MAKDEKVDEQEVARRRDEALKRALGMPHKPHKDGIGKKQKGAEKAISPKSRDR